MNRAARLKPCPFKASSLEARSWNSDAGIRPSHAHPQQPAPRHPSAADTLLAYLSSSFCFGLASSQGGSSCSRSSSHKEYVERAEKQQQRTFEVAPRRGVLYDRNLHELAMTVQVDSVYADPSEIEQQKGRRAHTCRRGTHRPRGHAHQRNARFSPASTPDTTSRGLHAASLPMFQRECMHST